MQRALIDLRSILHAIRLSMKQLNNWILTNNFSIKKNYFGFDWLVGADTQTDERIHVASHDAMTSNAEQTSSLLSTHSQCEPWTAHINCDCNI